MVKIILIFHIVLLFLAKGYAQIEPIKIFHIPDIPVGSQFSFGFLGGIRFTNNGDKMFVVSQFSTQIFDFDSGVPINQIIGGIAGWDFSSDYSLFATGIGVQGGSQIVDTNTGETINIYKGHNETVGTGRNILPTRIDVIDISHNDQFMVTVANDGKAIMWDLDTAEIIHTFTQVDQEHYEQTGEIVITGFLPGPATISPDDNYIAFLQSFWNTTTFEKEFEFEAVGATKVVLFNTNSENFISVNAIDLQIWDWSNRSLISEAELYSGSVFSIHHSIDNRYIITSGEDRINGQNDLKVHIFDTHSNTIVASITNDMIGETLGLKFQDNLPIQFHPNNKNFAVGVENKVLIYDLAEVLGIQSNIHNWNDYE